MKYLTRFLIVFFAISLFITNVEARVTPSPDYGCNPGDKFSRITGKPCGEMPTVSDCQPGDIYSASTGKKCEKEILPEEPVCSIVPFTLGSRGEEVKALQQKIHNAGFTPGKIDGIYGKMTSEAVSRYFKKYPCSEAGAVVISGVSGPQSLKVGETGTWKVSAYNKYGSALSYSVVWGDEYGKPVPPAVATSLRESQSATFTHSYSQAGNYNPTFYVSSANTVNCITTPCPSSAGNAQASLTVKVGEGEVAQKGTLYIDPSVLFLSVGGSKEVRAYYQPPMPPCPTGFSCAQVMPAPKEVNVSWYSADEDVASVARIDCAVIGGCGGAVMVRGHKGGLTELTAKYDYEGITLKAAARVNVAQTATTSY